MNSEKLNDWLSLSANIAVIIGIVVLVIEINQNTQAIRLTAYQDLTSQIVELNSQTLDSEYRREMTGNLGFLTPACQRVVEPGRELTTEEERFLNTWLFIALRHGDLAFFQYESGAIDYDRMISAMAPLSNILTLDFIQARWNQVKVNFVPEYRDFIDDLTMQMANRCP